MKGHNRVALFLAGRQVVKAGVWRSKCNAYETLRQHAPDLLKLVEVRAVWEGPFTSFPEAPAVPIVGLDAFDFFLGANDQ